MSTDPKREALDRLLADVYPVALRQRLRAILAGWMPRPEPRSDLEAEMAERLWVKLPPHEPPISVAEVQFALRAALAAPDTGGAGGE